MGVEGELAVAGELLQRVTLEHQAGVVVVEVLVDELALEDEEAAADPAGRRVGFSVNCSTTLSGS